MVIIRVLGILQTKKKKKNVRKEEVEGDSDDGASLNTERIRRMINYWW